MANKYWIGGTGQWDSTTTTNWAGSTPLTITASCSGAGTNTLTVTAGTGLVAGMKVYVGNTNLLLGTLSFTGTGSGGAGTYSVSAGSVVASTTMYAATTGVAAPTTSDAVFFGAYSGGLGYSLTIGSGAACLSLSCAPTVSLTLNSSSGSLTCAGDFSVNANVTVNASIVLTINITATSTITQNWVTSNTYGIDFTLNGAGATFTLATVFNSYSLNLINGTLALNGQTINAYSGFYFDQNNVVPGRSVAITGTGTITSTIINFSNYSAANSVASTVSYSSNISGTFVLNFSGATTTFTGITIGSQVTQARILAPNGVTLSGSTLSISRTTPVGLLLVGISNSITLSSTLTLGGGSYNTRVSLINSRPNNTLTITAPTRGTIQYTDFNNITFAGTALTGTSLGDLGGNTNITFTAAKTVYWSLASGGNWTTTAWATSSGGVAAAANYPLAQDTAIIDNTGLTAGNTITINADTNMPIVSASGRTTAFTLSCAVSAFVCNSITLPSVCTQSSYNWVILPKSTGYTISSGANTIFAGISTTTVGTVTIYGNTANPVTANSVTQYGMTIKCVYGNYTQGTGGTKVFGFDFGSSSPQTWMLPRSTVSADSCYQTFATGTSSTLQIMPTSTSTGRFQLLDCKNLSLTGTVKSVNIDAFNTPANVTYQISSGYGPSSANLPSCTVNLASTTNAIIQGAVTNVDMSGSTGTGTLSFLGNASDTSYTPYNACAIFGNFTGPAGATNGIGGGSNIDFTSTTSQTYNQGGMSLSTYSNTMYKTGTGTLTLSTNALNIPLGTFQLDYGTLSLGLSPTIGIFSSNNSNTRSIAFSTNRIICSKNSSTILDMGVATNFTYTGTPLFDMTYSGATGTRSLNFGTVGATSSNVISVTQSVASSTDTLTLSGGFLNLTLANHNGTISNTNLTVYGTTLTYSASATLSAGTNTLTLAPSTTLTVTTAGKTFDFPVTINGTGTTTFSGNLTLGSTRTLNLSSGTMSAVSAGTTVTCGSFTSNSGSVRALNVTNISLFTLSSGDWNVTATNLTFTGAPSVTLTGSSITQNFIGGAQTYGTLTLNGSNLTCIISGNNTFSNITAGTNKSTLTLTAGTTQTVTSFTFSGTATNQATLNSTTAGSTATLSDTTGTNTVTYLTIKDNTATGGATWDNSGVGNIVVSNVIGWTNSTGGTSANGMLAFLMQ